jgi:hypothetical protein
MLRFQGSLNSGPAYNLRCACVPRYDVRDMSCEGRHVERRVRKTGIHVGHTSARPDEENVQARMRARSRVQWFERKAVTRSSAHERRPHFATALPTLRTNERNRGAGELATCRARARTPRTRTTSQQRSNASAYQCRNEQSRYDRRLDIARSRAHARRCGRTRSRKQKTVHETRALFSVKS